MVALDVRPVLYVIGSLLIVLAMAVAGGDIILKQTTGESLSLGPVRPLYIAGPLGILGIVLILIRLVDD